MQSGLQVCRCGCNACRDDQGCRRRALVSVPFGGEQHLHNQVRRLSAFLDFPRWRYQLSHSLEA